MNSRGNHRALVGGLIRRRTMNLESLEDRRLLAFEPAAAPVSLGPELPYVAEPIADPFVRHAVTVDDMIARARTYPYMTNELVVAYEVGAGDAAVASWADRLGQADVSTISTILTVDRQAGPEISLVHLDLGPSGDVITAMQSLADDADVLWSAPNFYQTTDPRELIPNDPQYGSQYHHARMQNDLAWDTTLGDPSIIIGITDDGFDLDHVDLQANIWTNTGEIAGNGVDDDGNGYIDDVNGWDFITGNNNPNPNSASNDHGTHVAGIAAARTNNAVGVAGTAGNATIMPIQFYDLSLGWNAVEINAAFTYGADNGANIVTTSYNIDGWVGDPVFTAGLQYSYDQGVLHFNSAGNGGAANPARQAFEQTLLVVSTESNDTRSSFSNYGEGVDISAPGGSIRSTVLNNAYGVKSGTSMASPNAAGVAALIWSANPTWTREQVAAQLLATADNIDAQNPAFAGRLGAGRANSFRGVTETIGAPSVTDLVGFPDNGAAFFGLNLSDFSVRFSQVMDPASVNDVSSYELLNAGPDGMFDTTDDQLVPLALPKSYQVSTNEFTVNVLGGDLAPGDYRLSLVAGGLQNPFGTPLDGNGDGTGGDSFQSFFSIITLPPTVAGDDFESGTLDSDWTTYSSDAQGRIQITGSQGTAGGSFAMIMDRTPSGADTLNEAIWTVDMSQYSDPFLVFYHAEWGDEEMSLPLTFTGHANGDGVSISEDGSTWHRVFNPVTQPTGQWEKVVVDLGFAAANAGISLGSNFQVKFQQFDNFPLSTDGRGYDEIEIAANATVIDGDFNDDGSYDCADIDGLTMAIAAGTNDPAFDLNGDSAVNVDDLSAWLAEAGAVNNPSGTPYLPGDADLDGNVDGRDFNIWNSNAFSSVAAWCSGDFNADGFVDGRDFGIWSANKFTSSLAIAATPPTLIAERHALESAHAELQSADVRSILLPSALPKQSYVDTSQLRHGQQQPHEDRADQVFASLRGW